MTLARLPVSQPLEPCREAGPSPGGCPEVLGFLGRCNAEVYLLCGWIDSGGPATGALGGVHAKLSHTQKRLDKAILPLYSVYTLIQREIAR